MILTIRTDKPESEIGLFEDSKQVKYQKWQAHRDLSVTILSKIDDLLRSENLDKTDLKGVVVYQGPGSYTGLRIGITVANSLSKSIGIPVIGCQTEDWIENGIKRIGNSENDKQVIPVYGGEAHVTKPKK